MNPGAAPHTYSFSGSRKVTQRHGGGQPPSDADVSASGVATRSVTGSLTLEAHSGAVPLS